MRWVVVFLSLFVILVAEDQHLNANGPFGKRHTINDEPSSYACDRSQGLLSSSTTLTISNLNVSATVYSSNEEIRVTWTPLSSACEDDFIGVYFVEIPIEKGKYAIFLMTYSYNIINKFILYLACGYFDYEFVKAEQSSSSWQMVNLRRQLEFRYYSREHSCKGNYSLIAKSSVVQPVNDNEPTHIHLAYGNRIDQMFVSYLTN